MSHIMMFQNEERMTHFNKLTTRLNAEHIFLRVSDVRKIPNKSYLFKMCFLYMFAKPSHFPVFFFIGNTFLAFIHPCIFRAILKTVRHFRNSLLAYDLKKTKTF